MLEDADLLGTQLPKDHLLNERVVHSLQPLRVLEAACWVVVSEIDQFEPCFVDSKLVRVLPPILYDNILENVRDDVGLFRARHIGEVDQAGEGLFTLIFGIASQVLQRRGER